MLLSLFFGLLFSAAGSGVLVSLAGAMYLMRARKRFSGNVRVLVKAMSYMAFGAAALLVVRFGQFVLIVISGTLPVPPFDPGFYITVAFYILGIAILCVPAFTGYEAIKNMEFDD